MSPSPIYDIDNVRLDRVPGSTKDGRYDLIYYLRWFKIILIFIRSSVPLVDPSPSRNFFEPGRKGRFRVSRKLDFSKFDTNTPKRGSTITITVSFLDI